MVLDVFFHLSLDTGFKTQTIGTIGYRIVKKKLLVARPALVFGTKIILVNHPAHGVKRTNIILVDTTSLTQFDVLTMGTTLVNTASPNTHYRVMKANVTKRSLL
jgi:hypothetical protein